MPSATAISSADRVEASVFSGALVPCGHLDLFHLCAVVTLGTRQMKALDVVVPQTQNNFFAAVGVRPGIEIALSRVLAVHLQAELGVPLLRTTYTIDGTPRSTPSPVEGGVAAGVLGRFR